MIEGKECIKSLRLRFKNPKYDNIVKKNTEKVAKLMGFSDNDTFDIVLAVEEAYVNAIEHATSLSQHKDYELEIAYYIYPSQLVVLISDNGQGFDLEKIKNNNEIKHCYNSEIEIKQRGRGLELIKALADECDILTTPGYGTTIKIIKFLKKNIKKPKKSKH